jgi:parallel beta-helix repeat protein
MPERWQRRCWATVLAAAAAAGILTGLNAGSPDPTGPPGEPTMMPLDQVDPRRPIYGEMLPLTITESGSYYLAEDISTVAGGIRVQADGVSIDLMGFTLEGGTGPGIDGTGYYRTTVKNGKVHDWDGTGIRLGLRAVVSDVIVAENGGSGIRVGTDSRITDCSVSNSSVHGIIADGGSSVEGCILVGNYENGIWLSNGLVSGCLIFANGKSGIRTDGDSTILDNHIHQNDFVGATRKAGIWVNGNSNRIEGNMIVKNWIGIDLDGSDNVISANIIYNSTLIDLEVDPLASSNMVYVHDFGTMQWIPGSIWVNITY